MLDVYFKIIWGEGGGRRQGPDRFEVTRGTCLCHLPQVFHPGCGAHIVLGILVFLVAAAWLYLLISSSQPCEATSQQSQ